jgi:hypothetical protein
MHAANPVEKTTGFFYSGKKEVAMKMLMIVMMIRVILAFIETTMNKNRKNIRNDADNARVQHPAANLLR